MSFVNHKVQELKAMGFYAAERVDENTINKIINMREIEYCDLEATTIESYIGLLAQQIMWVQQEINISNAMEIELGVAFKMEALPYVIESKIRSVDERWTYAANLTPELKLKYDLWQRALSTSVLQEHIADPLVEKLQVLKRIYDERRMEGKNRNLHKYTDGSMGN